MEEKKKNPHLALYYLAQSYYLLHFYPPAPKVLWQLFSLHFPMLPRKIP